MPTEILPSQDDDRRLGVPGLGQRAFKPDPAPSDQPPGEPELRPGDTDLGRPAQVPGQIAALTEDDRRKLREEEEAQALRDLQEAEEMLASDPALNWFGWLAHPLAAALLLGLCGVLGLFLYSQVTVILASLATQPTGLQYLGYAGLLLCGSAVLYAILRLAWLYLRMRRNRQIRLAGLEELQARTRLRWLAHARVAEAKTQLEAYVRSYPLESARERRRLERVGFMPTMIQDLLHAREILLDAARFTTTVEWFEQFQKTFQARLDEAAESRVRYWSKRTGVVTALAPNALVDSAATIYFGFAMLADLCTVYNLRAGRTGTAVLLGRVFFNSYLAGQFNEWEKLTEEQLNQFLAPGGPVYELTAARVISKLGAKAASGVLNYFLLSRLGKYACRLLRPVA